jgi:hypothetical protein
LAEKLAAESTSIANFLKIKIQDSSSSVLHPNGFNPPIPSSTKMLLSRLSPRTLRSPPSALPRPNRSISIRRERVQGEKEEEEVQPLRQP